MTVANEFQANPPPTFAMPDDGCEETMVRRLAAWAIDFSSWGARTATPNVAYLNTQVGALKQWRDAQEALANQAKGRKTFLLLVAVCIGSLLSQALGSFFNRIFS